MAINWKQGIKRAHILILSIIWIFCLVVGFIDGPEVMSRVLPVLVVFTLGYVAFFAALAWVIRGFRG